MNLVFSEILVYLFFLDLTNDFSYNEHFKSYSILCCVYLYIKQLTGPANFVIHVRTNIKTLKSRLKMVIVGNNWDYVCIFADPNHEVIPNILYYLFSSIFIYIFFCIFGRY